MRGPINRGALKIPTISARLPAWPTGSQPAGGLLRNLALIVAVGLASVAH